MANRTVEKFELFDEVFDIRDSTVPEIKTALEESIASNVADLNSKITTVDNKITQRYVQTAYIDVANQAQFAAAMEKLNEGVIDLRIRFTAGGDYFITRRNINNINMHLTSVASTSPIIRWVSPYSQGAAGTPSWYGSKLNLSGTESAPIQFWFCYGGEDTGKYNYYAVWENMLLDVTYAQFNSALTLYNCEGTFERCTFTPNAVGTSNSHSIAAGLYINGSQIRLQECDLRMLGCPLDMTSLVRFHNNSEGLIFTDTDSVDHWNFTKDTAATNAKIPWFSASYSKIIMNTRMSVLPAACDANNNYFHFSWSELHTTNSQYNLVNSVGEQTSIWNRTNVFKLPDTAQVYPS